MTDTDWRERPRVWATPELPLADHIPEFASEAEEADFWATHDTSLLWEQGEDVTNDPPWVFFRDRSRPAKEGAGSETTDSGTDRAETQSS